MSKLMMTDLTTGRVSLRPQQFHLLPWLSYAYSYFLFKHPLYQPFSIPNQWFNNAF